MTPKSNDFQHTYWGTQVSDICANQLPKVCQKCSKNHPKSTFWLKWELSFRYSIYCTGATFPPPGRYSRPYKKRYCKKGAKMKQQVVTYDRWCPKRSPKWLPKLIKNLAKICFWGRYLPQGPQPAHFKVPRWFSRSWGVPPCSRNRQKNIEKRKEPITRGRQTKATKQTDWRTEEQATRQTKRQKPRRTNKQTNKQTSKQTNKQASNKLTTATTHQLLKKQRNKETKKRTNNNNERNEQTNEWTNKQTNQPKNTP
jgi:hypothetical protein